MMATLAQRILVANRFNVVFTRTTRDTVATMDSLALKKILALMGYVWVLPRTATIATNVLSTLAAKKEAVSISVTTLIPATMAYFAQIMIGAVVEFVLERKILAMMGILALETFAMKWLIVVLTYPAMMAMSVMMD